MTDLTVGITLKADGSGLVGEVKLSAQELERLRATAQGVGPAAGRSADGLNRLGREARGATTTIGSLRGALAGLGIAFGVREVVNFGREILDTSARMQTLETRIAAFVGRGPQLAETMGFIATTAQRQSQEIFTVAEAYSKLLPLADSGVISMADARDILVGFNDVAARTGATSAQLGQTMFGLSQALSSGVVRAEELNQVTEPLPGLLQALDRASGQAAGGFRRMVVDGEVTSAMFRTTLIDALKEYEGAAEETAGNLEAAATRFSNAWTLAIATVGENARDNTAGLLDFGARTLDWMREFFEAQAQGRLEARRVIAAVDLEAARADLAAQRAAAAAGESAVINIEAAKERVAELQEQLNAIDIVLGRFSGGRVPGGIPRPSTGGDSGGEVSAQYAKVTAAIEQQIAAERRLAEARGAGNEALRSALIANEAAVLIAKAGVEASSQEADVLRGLAAQLVDLSLAEQAYTEEKRRQAEATERATAAAERELRDREAAAARGRALIDSYRRLGQAITRDVMTPQEQYNQRLRELDFLLQTNNISLETYNRAVKKAGEELKEATGAGRDFKEGMRDAWQVIGTAAEDAVVKGKKFSDVLRGLEQDIIRIAWRMAVTKPLESAFGGLFDSINWSDLLGAVFNTGGIAGMGDTGPVQGGLYHGGGIIGRTPAPQRVVDPQLFNQAPRMHGGGIVPGEVPVIAKQGEVIGWPEQLRRAFGGNMTVQIIDQRSSGEIRTEEARGPNGERILQAFIVDTVEKSIGNGRFDRSLGSAFGVTRRGATR